MGLSRCHKISLPLFWLVLTALYCGVYTVAEFAVTPVNGLRSFAVCAAQWLTVTVLASAVLQIISLSRWVFTVLFTPLCLVSTASVYYFVTIGSGLSATAIEIAAVNDAAMWMTIITPTLLWLLAATGFVAAGLTFVRWRYVTPPGHKLTVALCAADIVVMMIPLHTSERLRRSVGGRLPYVIYCATDEYFSNRSAVKEVRDTYAATLAVADTTAVDVIFVIGEALRADHLPLNGYGRNTLPRLSRETNLVSFDSLYSDHTHTYAALPALMTRDDPDRPDARYDDQSFITLFRKAGYRSAWIANQDLGPSYIYFAHETDSIIPVNATRSLNSFTPWRDSDMLPHIERLLTDSGTPSYATLVVAHSIGSHWWYGSHYGERDDLFRPDADSREISALSHEQLINSYDNTILATDDFLADIIDLLRDRRAIMIYYSDHGESLGENGRYLHGAENAPLHHPAAMIWWSDEYEKTYPARVEAMRANRHRRAKTTSAFHTVLDAAGIDSPVLDREASLVSHGYRRP